MIRTFGAVALLTLATAMPVQDAAAQDPLGGALLGGVLGAGVGAAVGGGRGSSIAIGAIVGATAGAAIASQGQVRRGGYYWYEGRCWFRNPNGDYLRVQNRYCG
jgi:outer membrane lipoprotein SlyB